MTYRFDPQLVATAAASPAVRLDDLSAVRAEMGALEQSLRASRAPDPAVTDHLVPIPDGGRALPVRVYRPPTATDHAPVLIFLHGGGFVLGSIDLADDRSARLAAEVDAVVVSVGYRLAPEHPFPAAIEDAWAALRWVAAGAPALGLDDTRIAVGGHSAGAGLAAGLALLARDRGGPAPCFQLLDCPVLDDRLATPSMTAFVDTPNWNRAAAESSWRHYLGGGPETRPGGPGVSPYAAPARAADLAGLPPAHITACEFDPVRDEAIEYGHRLVRAGVPTDLRLYAGTFHGSAMVAGAEVSTRMRADQTAALRRALHGPAPSAGVVGL
jgi:acetyl esterase